MSRAKTKTTKAKPGRPSKYAPAFVAQAYKLALLGATMEQIADFFEVNGDTVHSWMRKHREFADALKSGRQDADANVAKSLYRRAIGYKRKAEKVFCLKDGTLVRAETFEYVPGDVTSCIFWLKNRAPKEWRDVARAPAGGNEGGGGLTVTIDADTLALCGVAPVASAEATATV